MMNTSSIKPDDLQFAQMIKQWGIELGFQQVGITDTQLIEHENHLERWLERGFHGEMDYMQKHGKKRSRPEELIPGTLKIISVRMDYLPPDINMAKVLRDKNKAYISIYALGRDYHKVMRSKLEKLAQKISEVSHPFGYRVFVDSAPVLEKAIAEKAGLGWIGKNTLVLNSKAGSYFFLGEIYTDLPLQSDLPQQTKHCGSCTACLDVCPTKAIVAPYQLDARRCISYLTIEYKGSIPEEFRKPIGNRIFGCDDCQLCCPWNKFAKVTKENNFYPRRHLVDVDLIELFSWSEEVFLKNTEGSAIRRAGYECWLRNIAIALGNAKTSLQIIDALKQRENDPSSLVREHVLWALEQQTRMKSG